MPTRRPRWLVGVTADRLPPADQFGFGTLIGRTTGEAFTMSFTGQGFVVVQPSEEVPGSFVAAPAEVSRQAPPGRPPPESSATSWAADAHRPACTIAHRAVTRTDQRFEY